MASHYFDDMADDVDSEMECYDDDQTQCEEADLIISRSQRRAKKSRDASQTQGGRSHESFVGDSSQTQEEVGIEDTQDSQRSQRSEYRAQKSRDAYKTLKIQGCITAIF